MSAPDESRPGMASGAADVNSIRLQSMSWTSSSRPDIRAAALAWFDAGFMPIPVRTDGSKGAAVKWGKYQFRRPSRAVVEALFDRDTDGLAVICGEASGNLEMLEVEGRAVHLVEDITEAMTDHGYADLWKRITGGYVEKSPSGGTHWFYRVIDGPSRPNRPLARRPATPAELAEKPDKFKVLIETRGQGGYTVAAPSGGRSHPTGEAWTTTHGTITVIAEITAAERDAIHAIIATTFDQMPSQPAPPSQPQQRPAAHDGALRPGDDFNGRAEWDDILTPHGWTRGRPCGKGSFWTRPGKDVRDGTSATTGTAKDGVDRLFVFTTSTEFEPGRPYSKFAAWTLLEHGGDYSAATKALRAAGYGDPGWTPQRRAGQLDGIIPTGQGAGSGNAGLAVRSGNAAGFPDRLDDAHLSEWMATYALHGRWRWTGGLGWLEWTGKRWKIVDETAVTEAVRQAVIDLHAKEAKAGASTDRLRKLDGLLSTARIRSVTTLVRGIVREDASNFDQRPDLLNVDNGVVDLRTGDLLPHDPDLLLTKITSVAYVPRARHPDWTQALGALPPEVRDWMQVRFGQAATGYATSDDVMPVLQGAGSNGKSTLLSGCCAALGEHATEVPQRVLLANPSDHPTELMTLFGTRLAIIEETPEAQHINVNRLKAVVGTPSMQARYIRRDNVTWKATHSLMLATNYKPRVDETDHGSWRRLALVRFPYTFAVSPLRERIEQNRDQQLVAALAWIVEGARRWYDNGCVMPEQPQAVRSDTEAWRAESDRVLGYIKDRIVFDPQACVAASELLDDFNKWLHEHGHRDWSDQLLTERFGQHSEVVERGVEKARPKAPKGLVARALGTTLPTRPTVWLGLRWRTDEDDETGNLEEQSRRSDAWGQEGQGSSVDAHEGARIVVNGDPLSHLSPGATALPTEGGVGGPHAGDGRPLCRRCQRRHLGRDEAETGVCRQCQRIAAYNPPATTTERTAS